jgi:hypothetical protein
MKVKVKAFFSFVVLLFLHNVATAVVAFELDEGSNIGPCSQLTEGVQQPNVDCAENLASCPLVPTNGICAGEEITDVGGVTVNLPCQAGATSANWKPVLQRCHRKAECRVAIVNGLEVCVATGAVSYSYVPKCVNYGSCIETP